MASVRARLLLSAACSMALMLGGCAGHGEGAAPAAIAAPEARQNESARLNAWLDRKFEEELQLSPMSLTRLGRKEQYDKLDATTYAADEAELAWKAATVQEMQRSINYDALDGDAKLSFDLWKYQYEQAVEANRWRDNAYLFTQMQGAHTGLPTFMINFHKVDTLGDMQAYNARLSQFPAYFDGLLVRAKTNAARGVRPPRFAYDTVLAEAKKLSSGAPYDAGADNALWADAKAKIAALQAKGAIDAAGADALRAETRQVLIASVKPAYEAIITFMSADAPNAPKTGVGVGGLPDGAAYYASRLQSSTTTDLTPAQVHQIGLDEVARIRAEMEAIKAKVGFAGDLQAFFTHVREAKWNYFPNTDEGRQGYIDAATAALDNIETQLPKYFGLLPKADLVVKRVEPFREQPGAAQHYNASSPDGSRPGVYYAHLIDMNAMPKNVLEVIAYHEGLPGHHMQIAIAQELTGVPQFRTQAGFSAFSEGWALYSELLAKEMPGTYADPYADFGRLTTEIWRAIRLVVDTGLHAKGWSEQEAIAYFAANSPVPPEAIKSEVRRYIVWPGQATSYKIGMLKILELRERARASLGARFDIRAFHDVVLGGGAMPLSLLERRVDAWIEERNKAA